MKLLATVPAEFDIMVRWITSREAVRRAKESGEPKPWTSDPLLRDYRWCNVRRMDDRVSRELFQHWYTPGADRRTDLAAAVLGRLINWPAALLEVTEGGRFTLDHLDRVSPVLRARADRREKVFTGAYIVPPARIDRNLGDAPLSKIDHVVEFARLFVQESYQVVTDSMRGTWEQLTRCDGMGPFLAGQIVADLAHLSAGAAWTDPPTWAPIGPGSTRGINRLQGRHKDKPVSQAEFEELLPQLVEVLRPRIAEIWNDRSLQAMDVQNCLCEFDKYRRLQRGEGKVRARYDGAATDLFEAAR